MTVPTKRSGPRRGRDASRALFLTWLTALLAAVGVPGALSGQGEIFERGNQLYQEGDYAGAIEAYEAVITAGFDSADLHYNLGNAYFKAGELGRSILEWERALLRAPSDADVLANLELARTLTADDIEPLPRFWLLRAAEWWVGWLPRGALLGVVAVSWLVLASGGITRLLARGASVQRIGTWSAAVGAVVFVVFGVNLLVREAGVGRAERAVVLVREVPVRSAPADQDDLTLFRVHEGTGVRIEDRAGEWAEIVLDDGKVGWVPIEAMEVVD